MDFIIINKHLIALTANNEYAVSFPKESLIDSQLSSFLNSDKKSNDFFLSFLFFWFYNVVLYPENAKKSETVISRENGDTIKTQKGR